MTMLATDDLTELVQGMGQASPGPLFLIDDAGLTHPLNAMAERLGDAEGSERAFMSPVHLGAGSTGRVVGYVPPGAGRRDESLVSALVAMVAGALSERFAGTPAPVAPTKNFPGDPSATLDRACSDLGVVCDEQRVGDIVLDAAICVLRGRWASLHVRRNDGDRLEALAATGLTDMPMCQAHLGRGLIGWAATQPEPLMLSEVGDLPAGAPDSARSELERGIPFPVPLALVPLRCGPELAGLLVVGGLPAAALDPELARRAVARLERLLDKAAGNLAGLRILRQVRREERVRRELEIAQQIQTGLLPLGETSVGDLHLSGECRPAAQVGGDWFGHESDEQGRLRFSLFDVAGHGIGAAVAMTMVRSVLQGALARSEHPAAALGAANSQIAADLAGSGLYATAFSARFDPEKEALEYACAGHAPPLHWSATQRRFLDHSEGGLPLGFVEAGDYPAASTPFGPGDLFVVCTDGIIEARSPAGETFGRARLVGALHRLRRRSARAIRRGLFRELERFAQGRPLHDDATLVVIKRACARRPSAPGAGSPGTDERTDDSHDGGSRD